MSQAIIRLKTQTKPISYKTETLGLKELKRMTTELFPCLRKTTWLDVVKLRAVLRRQAYGCLSLQSRDGFMNGNTVCLQQRANC